MTDAGPLLKARQIFYLAHSYFDAGEKERALAAYQERATLGFSDQDVFISLYRVAKLEAELGFDNERVIASYLKAHDVCKDTRAEALHGAARYCRTKEKYQRGFDLAERALNIKPPGDALYLEQWIYDYGMLDEYAVNAYWIGRFEECLKACRKILASAALSDADRKRIEANAKFAEQKLASSATTDLKHS